MDKRNNGVFNIKFLAKGNAVYCEISGDRDVQELCFPEKRGYTILQNKVICLYSRFLDLYKYNSILRDNIKVDSESILEFYGYCSGLKNHFYKKLTKSVIKEWSALDTVNLKKYYVNIGENLDGEITKMEVLVDKGWYSFGVSKNITEYEVKMIVEGREQSGLAEECYRVLKSRSMSDRQKKERFELVKEYELKIDSYLTQSKEEILQLAAINYLGIEVYNKEFYMLQRKYAEDNNVDLISKMLLGHDAEDMDSGFLYFKTTSDELTEDLIIANELHNERHKWYLNLNECLWIGQSTNIKRYIGRAAVQVLKDRYNEDIDFVTILD